MRDSGARWLLSGAPAVGVLTGTPPAVGPLVTIPTPGMGLRELAALVAVVLLVAGAVGSLLPVAPGGLLTLAGVHLYWWSTGFTEPGLPLVVAATILALLAMAVDLVAGAVAAGAAGTTKRVAAVAGLVGIALGLLTGPLGILVGIGGTVYVAERRDGTEREESLRTAGKTLLGLLVTYGVQFALTGLVLVAFLLVILL